MTARAPRSPTRPRVVDRSALSHHDGNIMMARTQITLDPELWRRARKRASQLGISLAGYVRQLLAKDLHEPETDVDPSVVFDLGRSRGADVSRAKDSMIGEAVAAGRSAKRREDR
jgi:hypothetical protein